MIPANCLLFVPGDRPDRFEKARQASPGGIIIDLEDGVAPADKDSARCATAAFLAQREHGTPVMVRLNPLETRAGLDDLMALADGYLSGDGLLLAKVEAPRDVEILRRHAPPQTPIMAAIETARALHGAVAIAGALRPGDALAFGGADLAADLGCAFSWEALQAARSAVVMAAALARICAFDVPYLNFRDPQGLQREAGRAKALGFTGKLAIHPSQVEPITAAFQPSAAEVLHARRIVEAAEAIGGATQVDGSMIDAAVVIASRRLLDQIL